MLVAERQTLERKIAIAHELARRQSARSLAAFQDHLVSNSSPPRRFSLIRKSRQDEVIGPMVPAYEHIAGLLPYYDGPTSLWRGLPRGHNKTSLVADLSVWLPCFSRYPIEIVVGPATVPKRPTSWPSCRRPSWLLRIEFKDYEAFGPRGAHLRVLSSDVGFASGLLADSLIVTSSRCRWLPGGTSAADLTSLRALRR